MICALDACTMDQAHSSCPIEKCADSVAVALVLITVFEFIPNYHYQGNYFIPRPGIWVHGNETMQ